MLHMSYAHTASTHAPPPVFATLADSSRTCLYPLARLSTYAYAHAYAYTHIHVPRSSSATRGAHPRCSRSGSLVSPVRRHVYRNVDRHANRLLKRPSIGLVSTCALAHTSVGIVSACKKAGLLECGRVKACARHVSTPCVLTCVRRVCRDLVLWLWRYCSLSRIAGSLRKSRVAHGSGR